MTVIRYRWESWLGSNKTRGEERAVTFLFLGVIRCRHWWQVGKGVANSALRNLRRKAKTGTPICLDFDAHSGFSRGSACEFRHEYFGRKNLRRCVEEKSPRRGGYRRRKVTRTSDGEIRASEKELRGNHKNAIGGQSLESNTDQEIGRTQFDDVEIAPPNKTFLLARRLCLFGWISISGDSSALAAQPFDWDDTPGDTEARTVLSKRAFNVSHGDISRFDFIEMEQR